MCQNIITADHLDVCDDGKSLHRYSWVLLLGGINDVARGTSSEIVSQSLMSMYQRVNVHKGRVLAMTCLQNRGSLMHHSWVEVERQKLNVFIREYAMKLGGPGGARLLDLGER